MKIQGGDEKKGPHEKLTVTGELLRQLVKKGRPSRKNKKQSVKRAKDW